MLVTRLRNTVRRLDELSFRGLALRSNIDQSYDALPAVGQRLFRRFALITTRDFPGWVAAALLDNDPFDAMEVVESLVDAQLLDTVQYPGERLRYRFHDLIRIYATERLRTAESETERTETVERLLGAWLVPHGARAPQGARRGLHDPPRHRPALARRPGAGGGRRDGQPDRLAGGANAARSCRPSTWPPITGCPRRAGTSRSPR